MATGTDGSPVSSARWSRGVCTYFRLAVDVATGTGGSHAVQIVKTFPSTIITVSIGAWVAVQMNGVTTEGDRVVIIRACSSPDGGAAGMSLWPRVGTFTCYAKGTHGGPCPSR